MSRRGNAGRFIAHERGAPLAEPTITRPASERAVAPEFQRLELRRYNA